MRESYQEKRRAFETFLQRYARIPLKDFSKSVFGESMFDGTAIPKADFLLELLHDDIRLDYWVFLRNKFRNLGYLTDRRNCEEYAFDLVLGWLSEELVKGELEAFSQKALAPTQQPKIDFMGVDAEREFQTGRIRANADIYIDIDSRPREEHQVQYEQTTGKKAIWREKETKAFRRWYEQNIQIKIDLFVDYKGTWQKKGYFDLKKGKMKHFGKNQLDWVLALDISNQLVYLIDREQALGCDFEENPAMGQKTAQVPLTTPFSTFDEVFHQLFSS